MAQFPPKSADIESPTTPDMTRRGALKAITVGANVAIGAALTAPVLGTIAFPLWGQTGEHTGDFSVIGPLSKFEQGKPSKFTVVGDSRDAWQTIRRKNLGAIWVVRENGNDFQVFSTVCPHLGCAINWENTREAFHCPCHGSEFDRSGARVESTEKQNPAPRGMDQLEWKIENDQLLVRYQRFVTGTNDKTTLG